jgi:hypothetical protein
VFQILSVTCDNASNNDTMIEHLATLVDSFPGASNQTRCFTHILNLVAKSVLRQFDMPKKKKGDDSDSELDDASRVLAALAEELELAPEGGNDDIDKGGDDLGDEGPLAGGDNDEEGGNDEIGDDQDGGVNGHNERDDMSEDEVAELENDVAPVRLMLTKVCRVQTQP